MNPPTNHPAPFVPDDVDEDIAPSPRATQYRRAATAAVSQPYGADAFEGCTCPWDPRACELPGAPHRSRSCRVDPLLDEDDAAWEASAR